MWVHFNLQCNRETQQRLHNLFRHKIRAWEKRALVKGAVLTYHFENKPTDSLYVCLNIPRVKKPQKRTRKLLNEAIQQIPPEIMDNIKKVCDQNQVKSEIIDYEWSIQSARASQGNQYYRGASVEEILRFASVGTKIALEILDLLKTGQRPWATDKELAGYILLRLRKELGENYFWLGQAWHFVCNPYFCVIHICGS